MWNDELAVLAQNYAEECVFAHNQERVSQQETFSSVGENLAANSGPADYADLVQRWYDEVNYYTYSSDTCADSKMCGHYTQVWLPEFVCACTCVWES